MKWTKLYLTDYGTAAAAQMCLNDTQYHTLLHVEEMFEFLHDNNVPYDVDLDAAVLAHDVIYDSGPNKEERSARWVRDFWKNNPDFFTDNGIDVGRVEDLIMATAGHKLTEDNEWILKADLHGLADPLRTMQNFIWITQENMVLYECSEKEAAQGTIDFMRVFRGTMLENYVNSHGDIFWSDVVNGVDNTILLANMILRD